MDGIILGFIGRIKSGKTTLSKYLAESLDLPRVSFGDYVRNVAKKQGLSESRETLQSIGASLIRKDPEGFCRNVLKQVDWKPGQSLLIDGIRHAEVIKILNKLTYPSKLLLIFVKVTGENQKQRLKTSNKNYITQIKELESHSTEIQVKESLRSSSDLVVDGSQPIAVLVESILTWIRNYTKMPEE